MHTSHTSRIKNNINLFFKDRYHFFTLGKLTCSEQRGNDWRVMCLWFPEALRREPHYKTGEYHLSSMVTSRVPLMILGHSRPDRWSFCCFSEFYFFHHISWLPRGLISMCLKSLGGNLLMSGPKKSIAKNNKGLSYFPFVPPPLDQLEKKWLLNSTKPHTSFFSQWITY